MKTIIVNWKANPSSLAEAQELFDFTVSETSKYQNVLTVICPPFVYLEKLAKRLQGSSLMYKMYKDDPCKLGAQDVPWDLGEENYGVKYALVGHSDRRYKIGETDEIINKKVKAALEAEITPVLLVGERNRGDDRAAVLEKQLAVDLDGLDSGQISKVLIAYEPVWAISITPGAIADTPESTLEAIKVIDNFIAGNPEKASGPRGFTGWKLGTENYLYGGSITKKNVADFLSHPEISGAVIGGASLHKEEFGEILRIVSGIK